MVLRIVRILAGEIDCEGDRGSTGSNDEVDELLLGLEQLLHLLIDLEFVICQRDGFVRIQSDPTSHQYLGCIVVIIIETKKVDDARQ